MADVKKTQAMPPDDRLKGAPDGVNTQAEKGATGGSDVGAPYPNPHGGKGGRDSDLEGFTGHGGQSINAYHGHGQLGDEEVEPGGNRNAGAKGD